MQTLLRLSKEALHFPASKAFNPYPSTPSNSSTLQHFDASTKLLFDQLANFFEAGVGFAAKYMQFIRKGRLNFFILQIREINSDVHSRSIDTSAHCQQTNTDIRNSS